MTDTGDNSEKDIQEELIPLTADQIDIERNNSETSASDKTQESSSMYDRLTSVLNKGDDDEMRICGYKRDRMKTILTWICIVLTGGFLRLVFYWKPYWYLFCTHKIATINTATCIHLKDQYNQDFVVHIKYMTTNGVRLTEKQAEASGYFSSIQINDPLSMKQMDKNGSFKNGQGHIDGDIIKYFHCKKVRYIYSTENLCFERLSGIEVGKKTSFFYETDSLTDAEAAKRAILYGKNRLEVHVTPVLRLVATQAVNPFYIFQLFSCILWYTDRYIYYASAILLISITSIAITTFSTRRMERALKHTVHQFNSATVKRNGETTTILPTELVPGDIIEIPRTGLIMDVDAVLLTGNCIVNESMLTGESIPVTKTPIPNPRGSVVLYDPKHHPKHTLYCGTKVIQTRYYGDQAVTAMVIRTGFMTAKGGLIRSIMFPKPVDFKFYRDTYYFLMALASVAFCGMIYTLVIMIKFRDAAVGLIIRRTLDLITIAVPPALPAALAVGVVVAQNRLKKRSQIYCIQPSYINIAGSINVVCFDKTGTLTEDGLDMYGVVPVKDSSCGDVVTDTASLPNDSLVKACMAACHSLTYIDNQLNGDPLDLKMFEATGWTLEEQGEEANRYDIIMPTVVKPKGGEPGPEVGILRQFTFSSSLQRMSVIVKNLSSPSFELFAKGSPEMISSLCKPETLPHDFASELAEYTRHGYRVIGLGHRELSLSYTKLQRCDRADVEKDLTFLGLLIMENRLKPQTIPVIKELHEANIRTIMVTGDNMLTAVSVAQECGFIAPGQTVILVSTTEQDGQIVVEYHSSESSNQDKDEKSNRMYNINGKTLIDIESECSRNYCFALTGKTWADIRQHHMYLIPKLVVKGCVFARMAPEQKGQLIEELQAIGYYVAMCGDGANDCGALKVAHSGISLSEAEASVASPFTSKITNIQCVPQLIREGRGALVTSFGVFKFVAGYSVCQFLSVIILYWISAGVTDFEFLYVDLVIITSISVTFPFTDPAKKLHRTPPPVKLASLLPILSLILNALIFGAVQVAAILIAKVQPWFEPFVNTESESYKSYENTSVFLVSQFQYLALAVMFAKGHPYRKNMFTNYFFLANILVVVALTLWIIIYPTEQFGGWLLLREPPSYEFKAYIIALGVGNFIFCLLMEMFFTGNERVQELILRVKVYFKGKEAKYELIQDELSASTSWPPVQNLETGFAEILNRELQSSISNTNFSTRL